VKDFGFGLDTLLTTPSLRAELHNKRLGLVAHPASVSATGVHALDALTAQGLGIARAFGPQHGLRGDKQDNMVESEDYVDPHHNIPVVSLYGEYRYPQPEMLKDLDIILFDLQDIGCRVYTFITTLRYFVEACAAENVALWILDRPNPAGRPIDGLYLEDGQQSFVGCDLLPMRHGLTVSELADWFADRIHCERPKTIPMTSYDPQQSPGFGWPIQPWINPSPNAASVNMTRCFPGTVLLEGTTLSEGRGTTTPLEVMGAPDLAVESLIDAIPADLYRGVRLRNCFFLPTFHKHNGEMCAGVQIHTDFSGYQHDHFRPYTLIAALLKALRGISPDYDLWRHHEYEYEVGRVPIDIINGGSFLREWVDDDSLGIDVFTSKLEVTREHWEKARQPYLRY
jgi:uncharacterized protein YbbC (DUF1343 family)